MAEISSAVSEVASTLGYDSLKSKQLQAVTTFLQGKDVFVAHPTGYGKSLCYACLPSTFNLLLKTEGQFTTKSIAVVISPLKALMKDQVSKFSARGLSAAYINEDFSYEMKLGVLSGDYQLVYFSPESILSHRRWRNLLKQEPYASHLVALVADEAHCVKKW